MEITFGLAGLGWAIVIAITLLDAKYNVGFTSFGSNLLSAVTVL